MYNIKMCQNTGIRVQENGNQEISTISRGTTQ
jgi:hypothetical protein